MKYALRALKWATIILWICFFIIISTVVYSAANVKVEMGEPQVFMENEKLIFTVPFTIINDGLYDISNLNITTALIDANGTTLTKSSNFAELIPKKKETDILHNISIDVGEMVKYQKYLFEDSNFTLLQEISLNFAKIVPFSAKANSTIPWGAPLHNFSFNGPSFQMINSTTSILLLNVSFENHSPYISLNGTLKIEFFNAYGELFGSTNEVIIVPPNSSYQKTITVFVKINKITSSGSINFTFETSTLSFGPLVFHYGSQE